jgi:hypothetical protein
LWYEATDVLKSERELIVIGSSLSAQDEHLNVFLKAWQNLSAKSEIRLTKIVTLGEDLRARCDLVFEGIKRKYEYWAEGFNESSLNFILKEQ